MTDFKDLKALLKSLRGTTEEQKKFDEAMKKKFGSKANYVKAISTSPKELLNSKDKQKSQESEKKEENQQKTTPVRNVRT